MTDLVAETVRDVIGGLSDRRDDDVEFDRAAWSALGDAGLTLIGLPEALGGAGGDLEQARSAVQAAAALGAAVPLAEQLFGALPALIAAAAPVPDEPFFAAATFARPAKLSVEPGPGGYTFTGTVARVPFARHAANLVIVTEYDGAGLVATVPLAAASLHPGLNVADEPRDDVVLDRVTAPGTAIPATELTRLRRLATLARAAQLSAATAEVLAMTVRYAGERTQFGRPITQFQAVAHNLAMMSGESAIAAAAVDAAFAAPDLGADSIAVAAAKARVNESALLVARTAHQVFGALGFTREHPLHRLTRRLWAWRDECGSTSVLQDALGAAAFAAGADGLWPLLSESAAALTE